MHKVVMHKVVMHKVVMHKVVMHKVVTAIHSTETRTIAILPVDSPAIVTR
jgi:hypothetical protein